MNNVFRVMTMGVLLVSAAACGDRGVSRASIASISAKFAQFAAAASGQDAQISSVVLASEHSPTGHPGFDTGTYPGDVAMRAWRTSDAPYEWAGFYLQSPCHQDPGWSGKRETLTSMGYGLAVIYVGQQTWGRKPGAPQMVSVPVTVKVNSRVGFGRRRHTVTRTVTRMVKRRVAGPPPGATCNADFVSAARGVAEGRDAVERTALQGFPPGTTVFLDLEQMDVLPQPMRDYYSAWARTVLADGRYRPGIYTHTMNANTVYSDVKAVYTTAGVTSEPPFWIAKSRGFDLRKLPSEMGHAFAAVWQGVLDVEQTWNGHKFPIDVNVSSSPSPSTPRLPVMSGAAAN